MGYRVMMLSPLLLIAAAALAAPAPTYDVDKAPTPLSEAEIVAALSEGHRVVFGASALASRVAMAAAQVGLENGRGAKVYNYNLGNVGAGEHEPHYVVGGRLSRARFKAYATPLDGAVGYWMVLRDRCSGSLAFFDAGDTVGATRHLGVCGYYRAAPERYGAGLRGLYWAEVGLVARLWAR